METNQILTDQEDVVEFLSELFGMGDNINLRTWGKGTSTNIYVNKDGFNEQTVDHFIKRAESQEMNVGFGVADRIDVRRRSNLENCGGVNALWVDIDGVNTHDFDAKAYADSVWDRCGFMPNYVVQSGNGIHLYWLLHDKVHIEPGPGVVNKPLLSKLRTLANMLGGDTKVCEPARIMRLPGTINFKGNHPTRSLLHTIHTKRECLKSFPEPTEAMVEGGRNNRIFTEARTLRDNGVRPENAMILLHALNERVCFPPLPDSEVEATARSAYTREPQTDDEGDRLPNPIESDIAEDFMANNGQDMRYETQMGWIYWNGTHWDVGERAEQHVKVRLRRYLSRILSQSRRTNEALHRLCVRLLTHKGVSSLAKMATLFTDYWVHASNMDRQDFKVNMKNGTVVVSAEGTSLGEHDREDLLTSVIDREIGDEEEPTQFLRFLYRVLGDDEDTVYYLQKCLGACILGNVGFSKALILFGDGANGKSVLAGILQECLGDYCTPVPSGTLTGRNDNAENKIASLMGKRVGLVHEFGSSASLNDERFKMLTGGEALISARMLFKNPHSFRPVTSFVILTNYLPAIRDSGHGLWRRMAPVPFKVVIPEHEQDHGLMRRIVKDEAEAVVGWIIKGAQLYLKHGADMPQSVEEALDEYRTSEDHIGTWLFENYDAATGDDFRVPLNEAYKSYNGWLKDQGIYAHLSKTNFGRQVCGRQLESENRKSRIDKRKIGGQTVFVNLSPKLGSLAFDIL